MSKAVSREQKLAIGAAIIFWRRLRGHNQKQLAELCGWHPGRISKYETADTWPDDDSLQTLARALGLPRATFYQGQEALLNHRARVLEQTGERTGEPDGPPPSREEVREPAAGLPEELAARWQELERAEAAVSTRRRSLEIETQAALLEAALRSAGQRS